MLRIVVVVLVGVVLSGCGESIDPAVGTALAEEAHAALVTIATDELGIPTESTREDTSQPCRGFTGTTDKTAVQLSSMWDLPDAVDTRVDRVFERAEDYLSARGDVDELNRTYGFRNTIHLGAFGDFNHVWITGPTPGAARFVFSVHAQGPCRIETGS